VSYANGRAMRRARLRRIANDTATLLGCTCRPDTEIVGAAHIAIWHDDDCPAIVGRLYAIVPRDYGRCGRC
jgi:hypothetical protein